MVIISGQDEDKTIKTVLTDKSGRIKLSDEEMIGYLNEILQEMKKMNIHLESMTDIHINNKDVK